MQDDAVLDRIGTLANDLKLANLRPQISACRSLLHHGDNLDVAASGGEKSASLATVTALRKTLLLRLPKAGFDELMFTHPAVLEAVSELSEKRGELIRKMQESGRIDLPQPLSFP